MHEATRIIRSTLSPVVAGEPLHAGPVFAGPYHAPGDISQTAYTYARSNNPTWTELERALAQMESGRQSSGRCCGREMWRCSRQTRTIRRGC
jgi:cystathionine gamma-lyase